MIQPFEIIEGMSSMKYISTFVSDSDKKPIEDRERYKTFIEIDPWGKLVKYRCECKGFMLGKRICKHIFDKNGNNGMLQLLKQWGEIQEIPNIKNE